MIKKAVCKHMDISAKNTLVQHFVNDEEITLQVQSWVCRECGDHGAETRIVKQLNEAT